MANLIFTGPMCSGKSTTVKNYVNETQQKDKWVEQDAIIKLFRQCRNLFVPINPHDVNAPTRKEWLKNELEKTCIGTFNDLSRANNPVHQDATKMPMSPEAVSSLLGQCEVVDILERPIRRKIDERLCENGVKLPPEERARLYEQMCNEVFELINNDEKGYQWDNGKADIRELLKTAGVKTDSAGKIDVGNLLVIVKLNNRINKFLDDNCREDQHTPGFNRREFFNMLRKPELTVDNIQEYTNKQLARVFGFQFDKTTESKCEDLLRDVTNGQSCFHAFWDALNASMGRSQSAEETQEKFKKMETIFTTMLVKSCEDKYISLGGGVPYFSEDRFLNNSELKHYKEILNAALQDDVVCYVKPYLDADKTKDELINRLKDRCSESGKFDERKFISEQSKINAHLETKCHDSISDITITQMGTGKTTTEQINDILKNMDKIVDGKNGGFGQEQDDAFMME